MIKNNLNILAVIILITPFVSAAMCPALTRYPDLVDVLDMLRDIGWPVALFMLIYMGIKWTTAEGAQDRENARRGIIYIVIGMLILLTAVDLTVYLLCYRPIASTLPPPTAWTDPCVPGVKRAVGTCASGGYETCIPSFYDVPTSHNLACCSTPGNCP